MIKVICGLGNPGQRYRHTRHNLGYEVIDSLAGPKRVDEFEAHPLFESLQVSLEGETVGLVKPLTFMNLSGLAVEAAMEYFEVPIEQFFVIVDDFNLQFGHLRIREKGSSGGHRGLESIIETIRRDSFSRLRLGVGPLPGGSIDLDSSMDLGSPMDSGSPSDRKEQISNFVLSRFGPDEEHDVPKIVSLATQAITTAIKDGVDAAINRYNNNNPTPEK